ncbi:LysR family transcriptional regulator [Methylocystis sp. WRRC1]|uniref:LysR family transcriptional regulator n=1 Tax=Methylocystis sp. WRRC1 TaxID=1732014 RepID=UPI001D14BC57|nr:LysR family transcriptional regulator [Methylocystis sp. WRRC1]MCC3247292.1 LysR family transcriptional regulator [Methylocystis sp. WRRC1]
MDRLNYQHLFYFWHVAREGGVTRACEKLRLAQPTISGQLAVFEKSIGSPLFRKEGRKLVLTETGRTVFNYAEEIFTLGQELSNTLKGTVGVRGQRLSVGVVNALPKLVVYRLLAPALHLNEPTQIVCYEDKRDRLLAELTLHGVDLVLSDAPATNAGGARVYNHVIGESTVAVFGAKGLAAQYREDFPWSLRGAPLLLQTTNTEVRRALDKWFEDRAIEPRVKAEVEDSALLKTFASGGAGLIIAPKSVRAEIERQYGLSFIGEIEEVTERYYAISMQRKVKHETVTRILKSAREWLS